MPVRSDARSSDSCTAFNGLLIGHGDLLRLSKRAQQSISLSLANRQAIQQRWLRMNHAELARSLVHHMAASNEGLNDAITAWIKVHATKCKELSSNNCHGADVNRAVMIEMVVSSRWAADSPA